MEVKLSNENFNKEVLNSEKPVLVDFWATWCGPCKMIAPIISEISEEFNNKVKVGKVNVDEEKELAIKYGISSIPTLVIFKDGTTGIFYNDSSVSEDNIEFNVERNCYILHNGGDFEWHNNCWMEI